MENNEEKKQNGNVMLPENFDDFQIAINILIGVLLFCIPIFGFFFKEDFLYFLPIIILIEIQFMRLKELVKTGTTSEMLVKKIKSIGTQLLVLWVVEVITYVGIILISK